MSIDFAILGFLSWRPLAGYDLKKLIADSEFLPWSGNNNQVYTTLVKLHRDELVTVEVQHQESLPARKTYSITEKGRASLRTWIISAPDTPQLRNSFLCQLAWADALQTAELDDLVGKYEHEVEMRLLVCREKIRREPPAPNRTARETFLWKMVHDNCVRAYEAELSWARELRRELARLSKPSEAAP
ncbi:MAG: PadR family transcriptional regulator [Deltaproteobacteria bacterium]|nr:PadR family transcriptional regulator [Deltaproteobacteria bacterium]